MKPKTPKKKQTRPKKRARPTPVTAPKKRQRKLSFRQKAVRVLIPLSILGVLSAYALFQVIDARVVARLNSLSTPKLPVIYSSPLDLTGLAKRLGDGSPQSLAILKSALLERRYSEVSGAPTRPGEFSLTPKTLFIFSRSYSNATGEVIPSRKEAITLGSPDSDSTSPRVSLEPQVISYIGSADVRASSFVPLGELPANIQHAVTSIEDERFYKHFGIDLISIARAAVRNLLAGRLVQGGSTLTQQLAKNLFLSPKRTISRKLLEVPTALSLERHLSKPQLLELYLNEVYLGQEGAVAIHGMPEAASSFYGKQIHDLTVDEAATLAGIIKAPSYYNPRRYPERARERRDLVLEKMHELGHISRSEYAVALKRPVKTVGQQEHRRLAPFYTSAVEAELSQTIDLDVAHATGLAVYTGLDLGMQRCAEQAVESGLASLEASHPKLTKDGRKPEAALVAIEPYSGLVKAWVGGRDFGTSQFNRVSQGVRQIGSTIKPFLYLSALDGSLNSYKVASPVSILEDKPMEVRQNGQKTWNPENYDHEFRGDVTLRYALEHSLNMPALYIAERIGLPALRRTLSLFKLAEQVQAVPALALGALDTNLLRLTAAYAALANSGMYIQPRLFVAALDSDGDRLSASTIFEERVAEESSTYVLTNILQGVIERGTGKGARSRGFDRPAAGKTGTSDNARDAWFMGFTPTLTAGVWVGYDDNSPLQLTGGAAAAPIWGEFMKCSAPYFGNADFIPPRGVSFVDVDVKSGGLATNDCPRENATREVFVTGTEPRRPCSLHSEGGAERGEGGDLYQPDGATREGGFWNRIFGG